MAEIEAKFEKIYHSQDQGKEFFYDLVVIKWK
jgi:hypothetical protein